MANIRTARRSGLVLRDGRQRRQMLWLQAVEIEATGTTAGFTTLLTSLNAAALALRPFTIVRTRGLLVARSDQVAASEFFSIAYGDIIVTDQAVAAGVGSVPTPAAEPQSDWHVFERLSGQFDFGTGVGFQIDSVERVIDSKAMRKVDLGEDLIGVQEVTLVSDGGVTLNSFTRVLIKLH